MSGTPPPSRGAIATIRSCTLYGNANQGIGGAISLWSADSPTVIERTIIAFNAQTQSLYCNAPETSITVTCCDIFGNAGNWVGCIADQQGQNGNITLDPLFCHANNGDFSLDSRSPCAPENSGSCGLIGAVPVGCGPVPVEPATWGRIKARFHNEVTLQGGD